MPLNVQSVGESVAAGSISLLLSRFKRCLQAVSPDQEVDEETEERVKRLIAWVSPMLKSAEERSRGVYAHSAEKHARDPYLQRIMDQISPADRSLHFAGRYRQTAVFLKRLIALCCELCSSGLPRTELNELQGKIAIFDEVVVRRAAELTGS